MCDQVHISNLLFVSHEFKILVRDFRFRNCYFSFSSLVLDNIRNTKFRQSTIGWLQVSESTSLIIHMSVQRESAAAENQSLATSSAGTQKNITTTGQIFWVFHGFHRLRSRNATQPKTSQSKQVHT